MMTLVEKIKKIASLEREGVLEYASLVDVLPQGVLIDIENVEAFTSLRKQSLLRVYQEMAHVTTEPVLRERAMEGEETWVDVRFLSVYYDVEELPFAHSYEAFWRFMHNRGEVQTKHEKEIRLFETTRYVTLNMAKEYVEFMQSYPYFKKLCEKKNEEHFLELVTHTAARPIQDFLFALVSESFRYLMKGGNLVGNR